MTTTWKKGRGKLGVFAPLLGSWKALGDGPMGPTEVTRTFSPTLGGKYIELKVRWSFAAPKGTKPREAYEETCLFGPHKEHGLAFWSFTSDGKKSTGHLADGTDIHPQALCFEAQMDAGLARQTYWPGEDGTIKWAVESKTKKGWNRFVEHTFKQIDA